MRTNNKNNPCQLVTRLIFVLICSFNSNLLFANQSYLSHSIVDNQLIVTTSKGLVKLSALEKGMMEVQVIQNDIEQMPSFAKQAKLNRLPMATKNSESMLIAINGKLSAKLNKADLSIHFYYENNHLTTQSDYFQSPKKRGFHFTLDDKEKILGGGQRVLGMDRRGHRLPLYNKAHYGYTTESNQMYFGMPLVWSSKKYGILFDNSASGYLDIGKTESNQLTFEAVGGRSAYLIFAGADYPSMLNSYVDITGKQPLPPRWAFGNYASRFGYRTEKEVRETVAQFQKKGFPLDTIIIDLYWFGPDIKGHVGNLDWDKKAFPNPVSMINDLKKQGIKTILITEPFILSSSSKWDDAVANGVLAKNDKGEPKRFDFYFGNTGLIDVFDSKAQQWFWGIYKELFAQGVAGTWGDLGEPEVHPDDAIHYLSDVGKTYRGDEIHNAYGHQWAKMVFENQRKLQPETRPFIMMRAGFAGSQRYGMIPWTGDVSRSWDGLKPQVELALQMGLSGMAYTHSDLGGFAGGEKFDKEMYIRWLQYGVFQPVYRPHAQDNIAPEPIFHDEETQAILREYIKLRYRLLPYNYTLAYENSTSGMPLMRPVFFEDESDLNLIDIKDQYLWGNAFLVSPITQSETNVHSMKLPEGVWFDFWNDTKYQGNQTIEFPVDLNRLPVLVRAGEFIPMVNDMASTAHYSSEKLNLHYYADNSVASSHGQMYEDDGESFGTIESSQHELLDFKSSQNKDGLRINLQRNGGVYSGMPSSREIRLIIHNIEKAPNKLSFDKNNFKLAAMDKSIAVGEYSYDSQKKLVTLLFNWDHAPLQLAIEY